MYTVRDFLDAGIVPWYRILSGRDLVETRPIKYISVQEYPAKNFPRRHELILSTVAGCEQDELFLALVRDVWEAGTSALLVTRPEDTITLPQLVLDYLEEHPLPVILIPWHILFADIIEEVSRQLRKDSSLKNTQYEQIQKILLEAYLANEDMHCAAQLLAEHLKSQVAIFNTDGQVKGRSRNLAGWSPEEMEKLFAAEENLLTIKAHDHVYGCIFIKPLNVKNLYDETLFLHYLIWPLILWFDKEWAIQSANQSAKDDFIWQLTKAPAESFEKLCEDGQRLGFQLRGSYTCIVGDIHTQDPGDNRATEQWVAANISQLKEEILRVAHAVHRRILVTYQKQLLILYLQSGDDIFQQNVNHFLDRLEKWSDEIFPQIRFTWGISGPGGDPTDFRKCFQDAALALKLCSGGSDQNTRFTFQDTVIYNAISFLNTNPHIRDSVKNIIAPLADYDAVTGSSLLETLQCYLTCKNFSETARLLHLHRQSLIYRINKIEELTGLDMKNADNFFLLELCVRLYASQKSG